MKFLSTTTLLSFSMLLATSVFAADNTANSNFLKEVDKNQCFGCHSTAIKTLSTRGAHKNLNCTSCHDIDANHLKAPSADNRPTTHFEYAACGQCHQEQHKDIMDPKYHYQWALNNKPQTYSVIRDIAGDNSFRDIQYRLPRFHSSIVTDLANIRSDGRYEYKDFYKDMSKPGAPMWEALIDTRPQEGDAIKPSKTLSLTWRPHKGREIMGRSDCLKCKTSDNMMDFAYLGKKHPKAPLAFNDPDHKVLKTVNNSFNCITCHDPHSAEPRIVFDHLIEAMTHKDFKDYNYQKNAGKTGYPKIEVFNMGVRGYPRKIAILEKANSNYMCGQCHQGHNRSETFYKDSDGQLAHPKAAIDREGWSVGTFFAADPIERWNIVRGLGLHNGIDKETGVKTVSTDHYHMETLVGSTHGKAGVGCTDCHFAKKENGKLEHQPSLPSLKYKNTCARSDCHGNPNGDNWSEGQAAYMVATIQQRYRIHKERLERYGAAARKLLIQAKNGDVKIPEAQYKELQDAYSLYLHTRGWYFSDYSEGVHDPRGFEKTSSEVIKKLRTATTEANKAIKG